MQMTIATHKTAAQGARAMRPAGDRFGLSCALITPFLPSGAIDHDRMVAHARRVLAEGCASVTLFGTTGEGASIGFGARAGAIAAMQSAGFDYGRHVLGAVAASSVEDAAAQASQLLDAGARGILLAPPFYFKGVDEDGLCTWFCRVLEACRAPRQVFLYHIPSLTQVPLSPSLVGRLRAAWPGVIAGVKDSAGDWPTTERFLAEHGDLHVLVGDERLLARAVRQGGSGAINGFSNFCAPRLLPMIERGEEVPGVAALVDLLLAYPVTPAVKALVAHVANDAEFLRTAPPLVDLPDAHARTLAAAFDRLP